MKRSLHFKNAIYLLGFILLYLEGYSQSQTFNNSGAFTFNVPAGVVNVTVEAWGAGGRGGTRTNSTGSNVGGGGGGGAYSRSIVAVTPSTGYNVTVGNGSSSTSAGGDSWFINNTTAMAKGGNSATNNSTSGAAGGLASLSVGTTKYNGGNGANGSGSNAGGGGSSAGSGSAGTFGSGANGGNAPTNGGNGGDGRQSSNGDGDNGAQPGGGGGGAYRTGGTRDGGEGGDGQVVISWTYAPDIYIQGNATTITDGDLIPSATDFTIFPATTVGSTSTRIYTIYNNGSAALTIGAITFSGANASEFAVTTSPAASVAVGASTTFTVTFTPTGGGTRSAEILIANNDPNEAPYNFGIEGTVANQEINFVGNGNNISDNDTSPSATDFTILGTTPVGIAITRTYTIQNLGGVPLTIGAATLSGTDAASFSITSFPSATILPGASSSIVISFNPSTNGTKNATLSVDNNDASENPYNFSIQGVAIIPDIAIQGNGNTILDGDTTPSAADWTILGSTSVGAAITRTYTIQNTGAAPLNLGAITIGGTNAADFTITSAPAATVAAAGNTTFTITFNPPMAGVRSASFSIVNDDPDEGPYNFSIEGTGTEQEMNVQGNATTIADGDTTPATGDWTILGSSPLGVPLTRTYTIQNTGTLPLTIGAITISGTDAASFTVSTLPAASVAAGGSTTFVVTFNAATIGVKNADLSIANNDFNENPYNFSIQGTGTAPEMNVLGNFATITDGDSTPAGVDHTDFGSVSIDSGTVTVTYTIQNTGTAPLTIGAITFSGANYTEWVLVSSPVPSIAAGTSSSFQVGFNPTGLGIRTGRISIVSNDTDENPYNWDITGIGVRTYVDTDNDGVSDTYDIDDDNDGALDSYEQAACVTMPLSSSVDHIFLNETFGTGTTKGLININIPGATCGYCYEDGVVGPNTVTCPSQSSRILDDGEYCVNYKITGTVGSDPENIHGDMAWYGGEDHTPGDTYGRMAVFNASYAPGTFYETTIVGVLPNAPITYSFWAINIMSQHNYVGSILPNITVEFLDTSNNVLSTFNTGQLGRCSGGVGDNSCAMSQWLQFATTVNLGNVTTFVIRLKNDAPGGGGNDLALDDIVIKQQYCDSDGDGVSNLFDLDSDNDGIADIEEAGFRQYSSGLSRMDMSSSLTWVDANANGLHDAIDAMIVGGTYALPNTDGDAVINMLDLDSDNDAQFDVDEAGIYNGDGDINGDGLGDGPDFDKDGILNIFDTSAGYGTLVRAFAQNTDGLGNPDYMQTDSNNDGVQDIAESLYANLDANNNGIIDGTGDSDKDGIVDTFDTKIMQIGSPRDLTRKLFLDFDGRNDYGEGSQLLSGLPQSTIMAWIKLTSPYSADGFVIGQDNFNIRVNLNSGNKIIVQANGLSLSYSTGINVNQWYHVAAVYDATHATEKLRLYVNGTKVSGSNNALLAGGLNASTANFTFGKHAVTATHYFKGAIEEVRVFNAALTDDILRKMVYQEIKSNGAMIRGEIIPKDIELSSWASLLAYYRMDAYKNDVIDDYKTASIDDGISPSFARIYNVKNIKYQLAPLPFVTSLSGTVDTAVSQNNFVNGTDAMTYEWSIIWIKHDIKFSFNQTSLGMLIDPGVYVALNNNNQLRNTWYLKLDGAIDLEGRSQLVQTLPSDLDPSSSGFIERDQQGQSNKFNYNYWSSPVGTINNLTNNNSYTVNGIMRDGTIPTNPQPFTWTSGVNGAPTSPVTLSSYWIFKFQNLTPIYANWASVGPNGTLLAGQGYTLKGSGSATPTQNFTFVGKPNNGLITSPIAGGNLNLSGNPYPSALDSNAFISANIASTTGTLYFWEHFSTNSSHNLADYQGGYATRTLVGGTPPVSPSGISGLGSSTRTPGRFVPVGQGFFVNGSVAGGNITFTNSQRTFIKEDNASSNIMFRTQQAMATESPFNNNEDAFEEDTFSKVRIGFNSWNNFHRQLLLGFMNEHATSAFDPGYDAPHIDSQPNDMYFMIGSDKVIIQGDTYFNADSAFPVTVKTNAAGPVQFTLDGTENLDEAQDIYIFDNLTNIYHDIRSQIFQVDLPVGVISDRFSLRFKTDEELGTNNFNGNNGDIIVAFTNDDDMITIKNKVPGTTVQTVMLYNIVGQSISRWTVENQDQAKIQLPVSDLSTGTYIIKVHTTNGDITKKVIIK